LNPGRERKYLSAYLIGHIRIIDPVAWQSYLAGVAKSLEPYAAKILFRGRKHAVLVGTHDQELAVVIRFTDQPTLQAWFHSDDYQSLIPLREQAADVTIISYDA
jgi:uncharacterized protein (DUF1330 family)